MREEFEEKIVQTVLSNFDIGNQVKAFEVCFNSNSNLLCSIKPILQNRQKHLANITAFLINVKLYYICKLLKQNK